MSIDTLGTAPAQTANRYAKAVQAQREFFSTGATRSLGFRLEQLRKLKAGIEKNEKNLVAALKADLGKSEMEAYATEVDVTKAEIDHICKNLAAWMRPQRVGTPLFFFPGNSYTIHEPFGVALVISPWNYPIKNLFGPLLGVIAAGNTAVLKPSEISAACSKAVAELISDVFDPRYIACIEGGVQDTSELLKERFDYLIFTGGTEIGRIVYQAAARHLTPVTLELGGKSPCIIDTEIDLDVTAKRVVWGKCVNAGQTCIAPDYILVNNKVKAQFIERVKHHIKDFFGDPAAKTDDLSRIISDRHFQRISKMLTGDIVCGGVTDASERFIYPTVIDNVTDEHPAMQEEIFGPVMPIIGYDRFDEVISRINRGQKPLALYLFSNNTQLQDRIVNETSSGAVLINETVIHAGHAGLPFGGVGNSGIGAYNGRVGFEQFSHRKPVLRRSFLFDVAQKYPPYNAAKVGFIKFAIKRLL